VVSASQICGRIDSIYSSLLEKNSTLLRKENDRVREILNLQQEIIALKSSPLLFPSHLLLVIPLPPMPARRKAQENIL